MNISYNILNNCIWYNYVNNFVLIFRFLFLQFNFVGKLLGPKGNSMKRLQEETMTKMAVLGRGSMRDKQKVSTSQALVTNSNLK